MRSLSFLAVALLAGCAHHPRLVLGNDDLQLGDVTELSDSEYAKLHRDAMAGDGKSSFALASYHLRPCSNETFFHMFYLKLSAEQGYCPGIREWARVQRSDQFETIHEAFDWKSRQAECAKLFVKTHPLVP